MSGRVAPSQPPPKLCEFELDGLIFTSAFDSGNATRVEQVAEDEYALWTARDCEGTPYANGCRTWFSFCVRGVAPGRTVRFQIHNMNSQGNVRPAQSEPVPRLR